MQPNFMFSWPHAQIGVSSFSDSPAELEEDTVRQELFEYPSSSLNHDGVILPSETRKVNVLQSSCGFSYY